MFLLAVNIGLYQSVLAAAMRILRDSLYRDFVSKNHYLCIEFSISRHHQPAHLLARWLLDTGDD